MFWKNLNKRRKVVLAMLVITFVDQGTLVFFAPFIDKPLCFDLLFKIGHPTLIDLPAFNSSGKRVEVKLTDSDYFIYQEMTGVQKRLAVCPGSKSLSITFPPCRLFGVHDTICTPRDHPLCLPVSLTDYLGYTLHVGWTIFDTAHNTATYYISLDNTYDIDLSQNTSLDTVWYDAQGCSFHLIWVAVFIPLSVCCLLACLTMCVASYFFGRRKQRAINLVRDRDTEHNGVPSNIRHRHTDRQQPSLSSDQTEGHEGIEESTNARADITNERTPLLERSLNGDRVPCLSTSPEMSYSGVQKGEDTLPGIIVPAAVQQDIGSISVRFPLLRRFVIPVAGMRWDRLGIFLGIEDILIQNIKEKFPTRFERACEKMLMRWLAHDDGTGDRPREWSTVIDALEKTGFREEARELGEKLAT